MNISAWEFTYQGKANIILESCGFLGDITIAANRWVTWSLIFA